MIYTSRTINKKVTETADVCIVGSGAGGGVVAGELSEAGLSVVVLEEGGFFTAEKDFNEIETESFLKVAAWGGFVATREGVILSYGRCLGGGTVKYWADSFRLPRDRFEQWRDPHGIGDEFYSYYDRVEGNLHVEVAPEYLFNEQNKRFREACKTLEWEGGAVPQARQACTSSGFCTLGCPYNRKQSMLVTYVPRASNAGARIFTNCRARRVITENGMAVGIQGTFLDPASETPTHEIEVHAKAVVVSAGGLGSAGLLLRSGVAHKRLGAQLFLNPNYWVMGKFPDPVHSYRNIPSPFAVHEWRKTRRDAQGRHIEGGYLILPGFLHPGSMAALSPWFGPELTEFMSKYDHYGLTLSILDDEVGGRVELDSEGREVPHYAISEPDALKARDYFKKSARMFLASGCEEVIFFDNVGTRVRKDSDIESAVNGIDMKRCIAVGPHIMGTVPMSKDPDFGVLDLNGEARGVKNLFVADGSVFPTSLSLDPSLTIMAFATKIAEGIKKRLA
ncbi:MAG: GMC family oxidoreductase [Nitrospirae bacterium]|nr:GMC family oxidoreductase [Nitrospirota bacterium]